LLFLASARELTTADTEITKKKESRELSALRGENAFVADP
jgi:hypothetical protein